MLGAASSGGCGQSGSPRSLPAARRGPSPMTTAGRGGVACGAIGCCSPRSRNRPLPTGWPIGRSSPPSPTPGGAGPPDPTGSLPHSTAKCSLAVDRLDGNATTAYRTSAGLRSSIFQVPKNAQVIVRAQVVSHQHLLPFPQSPEQPVETGAAIGSDL